MPALIKGKQIAVGTITASNLATDSVDSDELVDGSIDGSHLSTDAIDTVLDSKNVLVGVRASAVISSGTGTTLATDALTELIVESSVSGSVGGAPTVDGIVATASANICQLRDSANEAILDANDQVYARILSSIASIAAVTWTGALTFAATSTTGLVVGNVVGATATGPFFKVTAFTVDTDVTIENPSGFTIPTSGTTLEVLTLTLSYFKFPAGVETVYSGFSGGAVDLLINFPESTGLGGIPFKPLDEFGGFPEIIDDAIIAAEVFTDASAIGPNAGIVDTVQGVLEAFDAAITAAASSGDTPNQPAIASEAITASDTVLAAALPTTPVSAVSVLLFLNGIQQKQGAGFDYSVSGTAITWLASSGTAVDMEVSDDITTYYMS